MEIVSVPGSRRHEPSFVESLDELLRAHLAVVVRDLPPSPAEQLHVTQLLGRVVGRRDRSGSKVVPEFRHESDTAVNPYNTIWHSDTSWAAQPARFTLLYATAADDGCATTEFLDTSEAYASLPAPRQNEITSWRAWHHVELARRNADPDAVTAPATSSDSFVSATRRRVGRRWRRVRGGRSPGVVDAASSIDGVDVTELPRPAPPGVLHHVVRFDDRTQRRHLCLGEHAWKLEHLDEAASTAALAALHAETEIEPTSHRWRPNDLLVFDNRVLLHRRGRGDASRSTTRELRRTMAWTAGS